MKLNLIQALETFSIFSLKRTTKRASLEFRGCSKGTRGVQTNNFITKLLIKDNDDDLFHYAKETKTIFTSVKLGELLNEYFWDLFAFVSFMFKMLSFLSQTFYVNCCSPSSPSFVYRKSYAELHSQVFHC